MCSIEVEKPDEDMILVFNEMFSSFMKSFAGEQCFATVTPFGFHMRLQINAENDAFRIPRAFDEWLKMATERVMRHVFGETGPYPALAHTDYSIVPTSLLDPESFKKRVQASLDSEVKNEDD